MNLKNFLGYDLNLQEHIMCISSSIVTHGLVPIESEFCYQILCKCEIFLGDQLWKHGRKYINFLMDQNKV
jgi:hypothetical protein